MIEDAVKAQTKKITRLQTSVLKNAQDIDKNKTKYFSAKMGLGGGGNANNDGSKGPLSLAIGVNTEALGESSITLELFSSATGLRSASIGYGSESIGKYSFALGDFAIANGDSGIAIGKNSLLYENWEYSIALGLGAYIGKRKEVSSTAIIDSNNGGVFNRWKNDVESNITWRCFGNFYY